MNKKIKDNVSKAEALAEALPYIMQYHWQTVVIKLGGSVLTSADAINGIAVDLTLLRMVGVRLIIVHGGGPQIEHHLDRLGIASKFVDGLRVTDQQIMEVVEMVLGGLINKTIVSAIATAGGKAVGISGKDGGLIQAKRKRYGKADYGLVGEVELINPEVLDSLESGFIPVIAPLALSKGGETLNINADEVAAAVAIAVKAKSLLLMTDIDGVLDAKGKLVNQINRKQIKSLIKQGVVLGGMIPKLNCALNVVANQVESCRILDGRINHSILLELLTDRGSGTMIVG